MKIIISTRAIYPFHGYGGMQIYYYSLAKHLKKNGIDVEVVTSLDGTGRRTIEMDGIKFTFLPPNFNERRFMSFWYRIFNFNVKKYLQRTNFDVLHGTGGVYPYVLLRRRNPVIAQPFGMEQFKCKWFSKIRQFIMNYIPTKILINYSDAIASEGEFQTEEIINLFGVDREKIFNLPDGIDLASIDASLNGQKILRQDLGISDNDFVIINVNRLAKNKGVNYLIKASAILKKQIPNIKMIMIGTGPEEKKLTSLIKKLSLENIVHHFKNIPENILFQYYRLGDVFVCPTLNEGLPIVVLEAMACGLPIVATNVAGNPQVVKEGINGCLVPVASAEGIANGVIRMWQNRNRGEMGIRSREMVEKYDWGNIAKIAIKKYEELLRQKKK